MRITSDSISIIIIILLLASSAGFIISSEVTGEAHSPEELVSNKDNEIISWQVISSGGGVLGSSEDYEVTGAAGQTAVGEGSSETYGSSSGYWSPVLDICCDTPGDANNDGACNIGDEVFLGNYVFRSGQCDDPPGNPIGCPPECTAEGDANADGNVNIGDEVFLGNYIFRPPPASPAPVCGPEK